MQGYPALSGVLLATELCWRTDGCRRSRDCLDALRECRRAGHNHQWQHSAAWTADDLSLRVRPDRSLWLKDGHLHAAAATGRLLSRELRRRAGRLGELVQGDPLQD